MTSINVIFNTIYFVPGIFLSPSSLYKNEGILNGKRHFLYSASYQKKKSPGIYEVIFPYINVKYNASHYFWHLSFDEGAFFTITKENSENVLSLLLLLLLKSKLSWYSLKCVSILLIHLGKKHFRCSLEPARSCIRYKNNDWEAPVFWKLKKMSWF